MDSMDLRVRLVTGLQEQNIALREELLECKRLLALYGVDEHGAFLVEVDRFFARYGCEGVTI